MCLKSPLLGWSRLARHQGQAIGRTGTKVPKSQLRMFGVKRRKTGADLTSLIWLNDKTIWIIYSSTKSTASRAASHKSPTFRHNCPSQCVLAHAYNLFCCGQDQSNHISQKGKFISLQFSLLRSLRGKKTIWSWQLGSQSYINWMYKELNLTLD